MKFQKVVRLQCCGKRWNTFSRPIRCHGDDEHDDGCAVRTLGNQIGEGFPFQRGVDWREYASMMEGRRACELASGVVCATDWPVRF